MPNSGQNGTVSLESLEARYRHLDREVGSLREDVASHGAMLSQMNNTLQQIATRVHTPQQTNWQALIAAAALVFTVAAAYTTLSVKPLTDALSVVAERQSRSLEAGAFQQNEYARTLGNTEARLSRAEAELAEDDVTFAALMKMLNNIDRRVGFIEGKEAGLSR